VAGTIKKLLVSSQLIVLIFERLIMSFTLIVPQTSIWYLVRGAIALSFYAIGHQKKEKAIALFFVGRDPSSLLWRC